MRTHLLATPTAESDQILREAKSAAVSACCSKMEPQAIGEPYNSNVCNILPLTTLRTIDLEGRKNPALLFSRF